MENPENEVKGIYETLGNFSFKIKKFFYLPYQVATLIFCFSFYFLGFIIAILVDNYYDFISSWAVVIGFIGLYVTITTLIWAEEEFFNLITKKLRYSFDVIDEDYFQKIKEFLPEIYNFKRIIFCGIPYFLLAMSVVITFLQGTRERFLPGFNSNLIDSWIFMAYVVLWAGIVSFFAGMIVYYVLLICFKFNPMMKNFKIVFNLSHPDGMFGLKPLSIFLLKVVLIYYFVTSLFVIWLIPDFGIGSYFLVGSISLIGMGVYFIPQTGIHQAIERTKNEILKEINLTIDAKVLKNDLTDEIKINKLKNMIIINREASKINGGLLNRKTLTVILTTVGQLILYILRLYEKS